MPKVFTIKKILFYFYSSLLVTENYVLKERRGVLYTPGKGNINHNCIHLESQTTFNFISTEFSKRIRMRVWMHKRRFVTICREFELMFKGFQYTIIRENLSQQAYKMK